MVRQIVVYKWRKFNTGVTVPRSGRPAKMTAKMLHIWRSEKSTWMLLAKYTLDRLNQSWVVWEKHTQNVMCGEKGTVQSTPISKPHLCCKVWRTGHHDLEKLCCLRAWTACYHQLKTEFPSLSGHFGRECKASWSWVMQQENNPKRRSESTTECLQQKKICLLEWFRPALTST